MVGHPGVRAEDAGPLRPRPDARHRPRVDRAGGRARSASARRCAPTTTSPARTAVTDTAWPRAPTRTGCSPRCSVAPPDTAAARADRCTSPTRRPATSAPTPSSAAASASRPARRWASSSAASDQVAACFFGDGAANQGLLLEVDEHGGDLVAAVVYVCEDNQYGEYTPKAAVTAGEIGDRARALGIRLHRADGMDVLDVRGGRADRRGRGPGGQGAAVPALRDLPLRRARHGRPGPPLPHAGGRGAVAHPRSDQRRGRASCARGSTSPSTSRPSARRWRQRSSRRSSRARAEDLPGPEAVQLNVYAD